jgi:hypothetical protein
MRNGEIIAHALSMKLFGLTNQGLAAIGLLTLALWGILWAEHSLNQRTQETYQNLIEEWPATPAHNSAPKMPDTGSIG